MSHRLLLTYGKTRDKLTLLSSGTGTFDDLCDTVSREPEDIYFGFCRERDGESNYFAMIAFVPDGISGVRRGMMAPISFSTILMSLIHSKGTRPFSSCGNFI